MNILLRTIISVTVLLPAFAHAGDFARLTTNDSVAPGGQVNVRVSSSFMDLAEASVLWYANGTYITKSTASDSQSIGVGGLNEKTRVTAIITYRGAEYKEELVLTPSVLDIISEARTVVPPFYRGKAIASHDSPIRVMAASRFSADGEAEPAFSDYVWTKDGTAQLGRGIGANNTKLLGAWPNRAVNIGLVVTTGETKSSAKTSILSREPRPLFYEISPTRGFVTSPALAGTINRKDSKIDATIIPFGISLSDYTKGRIQYSWKVGGRLVSTGSGADGAKLTLSREADPNKKGVVTIGADIQSLVNALEHGAGEFKWNLER